MASFNFNVPKTTAPTFGATAPTFGATAPVAAVAPTPAFGNFNFGATTTSAPSTMPASSTTFGLGGGTTNPLQPTTTSSTLPTFGLGGTAPNTLSTLAPTSAAAPNFSFGKLATAVTTNVATLNFGTTTSSATSSFSGGLFAKPITTATAPATTATTTTPFVGLGGVDISQTQPKAGDPKPDNIKAKETQVPDEIVKTVEALKSHIKAQKTLASDIGRTSTSKLTNVSSETKALLWSLQEIANAVESNYNQIKLLRQETSKTLQSVEMAQRTQDTPTGLQYENVAPFQFFLNLVTQYERDLINFQQQITATEQHMCSLTNPRTVTAEELKRGMKQINECFISLAGRLHEIHQKVESQKEQYLNLRKYRLRDSTNVFAQLEKPSGKFDAANIASGPTPFSSISAMSSFGKTVSNTTSATATGANALPGGK